MLATPVPEDWTVMMLGQMLRERNERVSDRDFPPLSVTMGGVVPQLDHVAQTVHNDNRKLVRSGDLVINSRSDRKGAAGLAEQDGSVSLISIVMKPSEAHPGFLHYLLRSQPFQEEFYRRGQGIHADLWSTRYDALKRIEVAVPPPPAQRTIASFLDHETKKIDTLIEKKQRLLNLLEEKRTAVITQAVTRGLNPNVPLKDSGVEWLGKIPEHWEVAKLKSLATLQTGLTLGNSYSGDLEEVPYLRVANVQAGHIDTSDMATVAVPAQVTQRYALRRYDVLMTEGGDFDKLGRGFVWDAPIEPCLHQNHVFAVRTVQDELRPAFLAWLTTSEYGRAYFTATSKQSTNLASTNATKVRNLPIPVPPIDEQDRILEEFDRKLGLIQRTSTKIERAISLLKEYHTALISAAVTGKIDVRDKVPA